MKRILCLLVLLSLASWVVIILVHKKEISYTSAKSVNPIAKQEQATNHTILSGEKLSTSNVRNYVEHEAKLYGVNPIDAVFIVSHESEFGQHMIGDDGICHDVRSINYGKDTQSRGYWQINSCYHPEVTNKCAFDLSCSTKWSLNQILKGNISQWSTWRERRKYENSPD